jgi:nucleoside 2-deoxyribosyltransferase
VYISAPYTEKSEIKDKSQPYGQIKNIKYRKFLESIENIIKSCGLSTFLPHRDIHNWGYSFIEPNKIYQNSLEELKKCDIVVAYPEKSKGVNVDIGIAASLKKKLIIILKEKEKLSLTYPGLNLLSDIKIIRFKNMNDLEDQLKIYLGKEFKPKVYIAAPFTDKTNFHNPKVYGEIKNISYRNFLDVIESIIKEFGFQTFLPHRDIHKWGSVYIEPNVVAKKSLEALSSCDILITYPEKSAGANIELGWASAFNKKIILIVQEKESPSLMQLGLDGLTNTNVIRFKDIMDLKIKLRNTMSNLNI